MAFYADPNKKQDEEQSGNSVETGPESSIITPLQNQSVNSNNQQSQKKPAQFVGINDYLKANQGGVQQLGNHVVNTINSYANPAIDTIGQSTNDLNGQIKQGTTEYGTGLVESPNPVNYIGPKSTDQTTAYQNAKLATDQANHKASTAGSLEGQANIVGDTERQLIGDRAVGMKGASLLDSALVASDPATEQRVRDASANVQNNVNSAFNNFVTTGNNNIQAATDSTAAVNARVQKEKDARAAALAAMSAPQQQPIQQAPVYQNPTMGSAAPITPTQPVAPTPPSYIPQSPVAKKNLNLVSQAPTIVRRITQPWK